MTVFFRGPAGGRKARHDPAPGAHVLLGRRHAVEHVADGANHGGTLLRRVKKAGPIQFAFEMVEQAEQLRSRRWPGVGIGDAFDGGSVERGNASERRVGAFGFQPFIAEQEHGLRQAQRGKARD